MNKKQIAKKIINDNIDYFTLKRDINNSWLKGQNAEMLACNGLIHNYFYQWQLKAIEKAGYKFPQSNKTWGTMHDIVIELLRENI
ncbi:hypothetical protein WRP3_037 [Lactococcus phage WRP3]|uniref:Uncharacterized protein n=1 Tax=Lactococcus phage WRP3 TaxID=1560313 RepID=A0A0D3MSQ7_9CAUD|nr:hypothetical protein ACQ37_gp037 [Lactococcus phage WRP3]AIX12540.1 hypothetical protein WRP3_037 [Lactococcus phage WRP3]